MLAMFFVVINISIIFTIIHGFSRPQISAIYNVPATSHSRLLMSTNFPTSIKNVISRMTAATQKALRQKKSRIEIELPPGVDFGLDLNRKNSIKNEEMSSLDKIKRSNRDAARLFIEMFNSINIPTVVLFPEAEEARAARDLWGATCRGQTLSIDTPKVKGYSKLRSRRFTLEEQEQALFSTDGIYVPNDTELLIVAGPRPKDFNKLKTLHQKFGEGTLIIIINAKVDLIESTSKSTDDSQSNVDEKTQWLKSDFDCVFHYAPPAALPATEINNRELLLFHEIDESWYLAEKEKGSGMMKGLFGLGNAANSGFTTILETPNRPRIEELRAALKSSSPL